MDGEQWLETKLLDFGSAKWLQIDEDVGDVITKRGGIVGTPIYMTPEQLAGELCDHRADVYSFGLVCYESIAGVLPFPITGTLQALAVSKAQPHLGLRAQLPEVPAELEAVLTRALAIDPDDRYPDMQEFVDALRPFAKIEVEAIIPLPGATRPRALKNTLAPALSSTGAVGLAISIFGDPGDRVAALREKVRFYNDSMASEYQQLTYLVRSAHVLWLACVATTFAIMIAVVLLVAAGYHETAIVAGIADVLAGLIGVLFQRREDHYRELSERKRVHLEYGQEWATTLHSIDAIKHEARKEELLERLIETQIERLKEKSKTLSP
jgi:hypothetical protein